jgi:lambda repressor-like predicted transcriptional regulator
MEHRFQNLQLLLPGKSVATLAKKLGLSQSAVRKALKRGNPKHPVVAYAVHMAKVMGWELERYGYNVMVVSQNPHHYIRQARNSFVTNIDSLIQATDRLLAPRPYSLSQAEFEDECPF